MNCSNCGAPPRPGNAGVCSYCDTVLDTAPEPCPPVGLTINLTPAAITADGANWIAQYVNAASSLPPSGFRIHRL